jgi:uncharacterized protein
MTQIHPEPGKFRRFIAHPGTLLILGFVVMAVAYTLSQFGMFADEALHVPDTHPIVVPAALVAAEFVTVCYWLFVRYVERQPFSDFARGGVVQETVMGIAIGVGLFSAVVGVLAIFGDYHVTGTRHFDVLLPVFGMALISGVGEEIVLRGVFFRYAEDWLGSWAALALSAALFGALHLGNPNATFLAAFAIAIEAGVMLAAIYMITRRLWAAIGLHFAWNFVQGGVYGIAVSGNATKGVLIAQVSGPDLMTGGRFGAEASLPAMIIATTAGVVMLVYAHKLGRFVAPRWVRQRSHKTIGVNVNAHADTARPVDTA